MTRRFAYVLGAVLVALVQARLLPELGLQRALNLPAVVLIVTSSVERRTLALAAATVAGLTIDVALLRPLGLTSLALVVGVAVASQIRGAGDAPIVRRAAAILFGFVASNVTMVVLNGGSTGENTPSFGLNIAIAIALAWFGQRRRTSYQLDRSLRG
jgi:rod shape-determining protein MreD